MTARARPPFDAELEPAGCGARFTASGPVGVGPASPPRLRRCGRRPQRQLGTGVDLGEELAAELAAQQPEDGDQEGHRDEDGGEAMGHDSVEQACVPRDPHLDQALPAGEGAGEYAP